jgi:hypothetical protein
VAANVSTRAAGLQRNPADTTCSGKDSLGMDGSSDYNSCFGWHVSVTSPISYSSLFPLFKIMEKSVLTTSFADAVVDITIFLPLSTIDIPLPYGCSPLGSFQVGYSDVWSERIPIGCSRAQLKASIGSLPNVNSNGLRVSSQKSFLMLDTVVFVYEVELDHNANWLLDTLDLSLLSNGVDFALRPDEELVDILVACRRHSKQSDGIVAGAR